MTKERLSRTDRLAEMADRMAETTGIDPELCRLSAAWAQDMAAALKANPPRELNKKYFDNLLEETGERILVLPCDNDGIPLYRVRYAAANMFYNLIAHDYPNARADIEGSPLEITVHYDRLDEICQTFLGIQQSNDYPYNLPHAEVPNRSSNMPSEEVLPRGTEQHAQYLWHVCYWMAGGVESNIAFKFLSKMYTDHPQLFDPRYIVEHEITEEEIANVISQYSALNFNLDRIKTYWIENAHKMVAHYEGDVRKVFDGAQSYRTITGRLVNNKRGQGFSGFQEKMASMCAHFAADAGIIDEIPFPPAVDFHLLRLAASLGILTFDNVPDRGILEKKTIATLRKMLYDYIIVTGISELELDDALWRYSKLMCAEAPTSTSTVDRTAARGEKSVVGTPDYSNPSIMKKYARSCGRCVVSHLCTFSVDSGGYYNDDRVMPTKRIGPHDEPALVPFDDSMLAAPPQNILPTDNEVPPISHPVLEI